MSLLIIVSFQIIIALPFVLSETSVKDYISRSKLTGEGRNGVAFAAEYWDYLAAHKDLTIFWSFLSEEMYYNKAYLATMCRIMMPALNVYHFFIRKNAFPECWANLMSFLQLKPDKTGFSSLEQRRNTIEILVIGYFCGITFMPGAHSQF